MPSTPRDNYDFGYGSRRGGYREPEYEDYGPYAPRMRSTGSSITDLILEQGRQGAESSQRSGNLWGQTVKDIGAGITGAMEAHAAGKRDAAWTAYVQSGEWQQDPAGLYGKAREVWGPDKADDQIKGLASFMQLRQMLSPERGKPIDPDEARKRVYDIGKALKEQGEGAWSASWPAIAPLVNQVYPNLVPNEYQPGLNTRIIPLIDQFKPAEKFDTKKPEDAIFNTGTGVVTDPGTPPEPKPDTRQVNIRIEEARARGDEAEAQRLLKVEADLAAARRDPRSAAQDELDRAKLDDYRTGKTNKQASADQIADAWAAGMAFPSTQEATTAALESFNRRGLPVPRKLTSPMQADVARQAETVVRLEDIANAYRKVRDQVGPVEFQFRQFAQKVPGIEANPDFREFQQLVGNMNSLEIQRITGASMQDTEARRLLGSMATGGLKPAEFERALAIMVRNARRSRDMTLYGSQANARTFRERGEGGRQGSGAGGAGGANTSGRPKPQSRADLDKLPAGTEYEAPDGSIRRKR